MEETKIRDSNTKTQLSLAAALFFSLLVQHILKKNTRDITDQDKDFIRGYIKLGYITLLLGIVVVITGVLHYLFLLNILNIIYTVSIFILLSLLIISVVSILSDISLVKGGSSNTQTYTIEGNKKDILLKYLPLYNIYLRYYTHNFETPNRWIKESILLRTLFVLVCIVGSIRGSTILLIIIIIRIASLMSDIDIVNLQAKKRINKIFFKNPEEIRAYITGFLCYLRKSFIHLFKARKAYTLESEIEKEKISYGRIIDSKGNISLIIEYLLGLAIFIGLIYLIKPNLNIRTYYVGWGLIIGRYLIMILQLKHLPHLPIAREIMLLIKRIGSIFRKKSFTPNI